MIVGTHRLYNMSEEVSLHQVIEVRDGFVTDIYPFEAELHSMVWFDAVVLSDSLFEKRLFDTMDNLLKFTGRNLNIETPCRAYGVTIDSDGCLLEPLI